MNLPMKGFGPVHFGKLDGQERTFGVFFVHVMCT
jgi:hypothetical protein